MNTGRNSEQPATGGRGTLSAQRTGFNTLDNWGHKAPTQSKRKRTRKKRLKGHNMYTIHSVKFFSIFFSFFILDRDISVESLLWFKKVYILLMSMSHLLLVNTFAFFFAACSYHQQSFASFSQCFSCFLDILKILLLMTMSQ